MPRKSYPMPPSSTVVDAQSPFGKWLLDYVPSVPDFRSGRWVAPLEVEDGNGQRVLYPSATMAFRPDGYGIRGTVSYKGARRACIDTSDTYLLSTGEYVKLDYIVLCR